MSSKLNSLRKRFIQTMEEVSSILGISIGEIKRDDYIRASVDMGIEGRLNKVELNLLGGFKKAKNVYFKKEVLKANRPKILVFDIETAPLEALVWGIWDQRIPLNMIQEDWSVLAWAAKWLGESPSKTIYMDTSKQKNLRDDKKILETIWKMLDEADFVLGHNSDSFDIKKLNARFLMHGMKPPSSYKRFDTKKLAKKHFSLTSNKLEYITHHLCTKYKKLSHKKFPGTELWIEYLKRNKEAFEEMKKYNIYDVLSLEEAFLKILPWESANIFETYYDSEINICTCGSIDFKKKGHYHTPSGKFHKLICNSCGAETREKNNLLSKDKKASLRRKTTR
jgi:DNA polymerase elongation subunit (family B)